MWRKSDCLGVSDKKKDEPEQEVPTGHSESQNKHQAACEANSLVRNKYLD